MNEKKCGEMMIYPVPDPSELDMGEIENIVRHTHNTWQHDRPLWEIRKNTVQGKSAELVIERFMAENSSLRYRSYDAIRGDHFEKHAPFDGVIFDARISDVILKEAFDRIREDVNESPGDCGTIAVRTREFLEDSGVFTVEIKSSLLQDPRDYRAMGQKEKGRRSQKDYEALCAHIRNSYDYFVYPHYCRDHRGITNFYEYASYVKSSHPEFETRSTGEFLRRLMRTEWDHACDIYTRVFFDVLSDEIILPGYVTKDRFFEEPRIRKMPSPKSGNAIYYMYPIKLGAGMADMDRDARLKNWNRGSMTSELFGSKRPACPECGKPLKLVETKKGEPARHKFLYVCENCNPPSWYQMNRIHGKNMEAR